MLDGRDASTAQSVASNFARRSGALAAMAIALSLQFVGTAAASGAPRFHLRGVARIDAHASRSQGKLVISGTVLDDVGAPLTDHARVAVQISTDTHDRPLLTSGLVSALSMEPEACSDTSPAMTGLDGDTRAVVATDGSARFCVRLALPTGRYVVHLEAPWDGPPVGDLVDGARIDLPVDLALAPVTLRFDPERATLPLDDESSPVEVVATTEDDGLTAAAANLPLTLSNESGRTLGSATTDGGGRAHFVVPGALFGPAGQGELRVSFAGSGEAGASSQVAVVERRARVALDAPQATDGRLPPASAEKELALHVVARTTCAARGCEGVPTGTIEARLGEGDIVGASALSRGEARVIVTLPAPPPGEGNGDAPLRLDYVPDAPWFESTGPLRLSQPVEPPGSWEKVVLALTGLGVVAWLGLGRLPRRREGQARPARGAKIAASVASVELVSPAVVGAERWNGRVVDGHEGTAVAGARVAIERPGFERAAVVAEATTDSDGAFVLAPFAIQPGDRLVAEGPFHGALQLPVPAFGEIRVALVSRKRALLDRLVAWARRRGRPFDAQPEPTPGHVQRMARPGDAVKVWADAVERAMYSGAAIDAGSEAEVNRLAPGDPSPAQRDYVVGPGAADRGRR